MKKLFIGVAVLGLVAVVLGLFVLKNSGISAVLTRGGGIAALIGLALSIYFSFKK